MINRNKLGVVLLVGLMVGTLAFLAASLPVVAKAAEKGEPIVIGVPVPRASGHGQNAEQALILAVEEINAAGGIKLGGKGRPIKLEITDTRDQEPGVPTSDVLLAIEKLILGKKPHLLMGGPIMSEPSLVTLDLIAKHKMLHITTAGAWTPAWHKKTGKNISRYKYSFKIGSNIVFQMKDIAGLLHGIKTQFGFNKLFISVADAAHTRAAGNAVGGMAKKGGWEIVGKEIHPLATSDFSMLLRKVRKSGAQLLFIWDHTPEAVILMRQWYDLKIPALPLGMVDSVGDPAMWKRTNKKVAYLVGVGGESGTLPGQEVTPLTKPFFAAFKKRWKKEPRALIVSPSYFGPYMIKEVIEKTQSLDTDTLITAIENVDMVTVSGRLRINKSNHQAIYGKDPKQTLVNQFYQWQDGKRISVWPEAIATRKIQLPPWMKK